MVRKSLVFGASIAIMILLITLSISLVSAYAKDVGYIVENKYYVNPNFVNVINNFSLSYEVILASNLSKINFSNYRMIIFNDEDFQHPELIPVNKVPAVILNGKNMPEWGWCKSISRTSQDDFFEIDLINFNHTITSGFNKSRVLIYTEIDPDVYNIKPENMYSGLTIVASMKNRPGDGIIVAAEAGSVLTYPGRPNTYVDAKTCFFGITESAYWTEDTKKLFKGCMGFVAITCSNNADCNDNNANTLDTCHNPATVQSYCTHEPIKCFSDSDCGVNFNSSNFCSSSSGDVFKNQTIFSCLNKGTVQAQCVNNTSPIMIDDCSKGCSAGACIAAHDVGFADNYDGFGNKIRLRDPNNTIIDSPPTTITQKGEYDIQFQIENKGDFSETGNINCRIENSSGHVFYSWASSFTIAAGDTSLTGNKNNYDLSGYSNGNYTIKCNLTIPGDDSPSNNYAERAIIINYPNINCYLDSDCGIDGFIGGNTCTGKNITRPFRDYTCNNPGTAQSYCSNSQINQLVQQCTDYCLNGQCGDYVCERDSDCNDQNPLTYDKCINPSTPISECRNTRINCASDGDCGFTGFLGEQYCNRDNVFKNYQQSLCRHPGTLDSYCTLRITANKTNECEYACILNGICIRCDEDSDCDDGDVNTEDNCHSPGTVESHCDNDEIECEDNDQDGYDICNPGDPGDDGNPSDCNDNNANVNPGATEVCNQIDDDCDGMIDENGVCGQCTPGQTRNCGSEVGECSYGIQTCTADYIWGSCVGAIGPTTEICDGLDNDCDGQVDEGGVCGQCTPGQTQQCGLTDVGVCAFGIRTCTADYLWGNCIGAISPSTETCNELDDDCDGFIDEGGVCEPVCGNIQATVYNIRKNTLPKPACTENCWYRFSLNITETTGLAAVNLTHRDLWWLNGDNEIRFDAATRFGTSIVSAGETLTDNNRYLCTCYHPDQLTETWYGSSGGFCSEVSDGFTINIP